MPRAKVNFAKRCPAGQECPIGLGVIDRNKAVYINGQFYDAEEICTMTKNERANLRAEGRPLHAIQAMQRRVPHSRNPISEENVLAICYRAKDWAERKLYWRVILNDIRTRLTFMLPSRSFGEERSMMTLDLFARPETGPNIKVASIDVVREADGSYIVSILVGKKRSTKQTMIYVETIVKWIDDTFHGGRDFFGRPVLEGRVLYTPVGRWHYMYR